MVKSGKGSRLYLLTGLVIGYVLAYIASCTVLPLEYYDINPASLHHDLKMDYFVLIADAFASNEDIGRAAARINALLDNPDMNDLRVLQFEIESDDRYIESGEAVRSLVNHMDVFLQAIGGSAVPAETPAPGPDAPAEFIPTAVPDEDPFSSHPDGEARSFYG